MGEGVEGVRAKPGRSCFPEAIARFLGLKMPEIAFLKNSILKKISLKDVPGPPSVLEPPSLKSYISPRNLDNISLLMIFLFFITYLLDNVMILQGEIRF